MKNIASEKAANASVNMLRYVEASPIGAKVTAALRNLNEAIKVAESQGTGASQLAKARNAAYQAIKLDVLEMSLHRRGELEKAVNAVRDTYTAGAARMRSTNELVVSEFRDHIGAMTDAEITQMAQGVIHGKTSLNPREADILSSALRGVDDGLYVELRKNLTESNYDKPWLKDPGIKDVVAELELSKLAAGQDIIVNVNGKMAALNVESIADYLDAAGGDEE